MEPIPKNSELYASPEAFEAAVESVASELHEEWRKTRLKEDGSFEPRIKTTKDEAWIASHDTNEVDIANTEYPDLPDDWKEENAKAASVVVDIIAKEGGIPNIEDDDIRNQVGDTIHSAWLERNDWAKGGDLDVPFIELPANEQQKDIDQMIVAQRVLS